MKEWYMILEILEIAVLGVGVSGFYIFGLRFRSFIITILVMVKAEVESRKYKNEQ